MDLIVVVVLLLATQSASGTNGAKGLEVGVCITGQMQRLELPSKIKNVFKYGKEEKGHTFDVVLVMNEDVTAPPVYVNNKIPDSNASDQVNIHQVEVMDPVGVTNGLRAWSRTLTEVYIPSVDEPVLNAEYVNKLNDKSKQSVQKRLLRAKSHVRQWYYFRRCYDAMLENEFILNRKYDVMVRLRDDNFIAGPMDPGIMAKYTPKFPNTIILSSCEQWRKHSINDKGAIVSREAARVYFTAPLDTYYIYPRKVFKMKTTQVMSPEIWLNHVYGRVNGFNMVHDVSEFPVMTYRHLPKELSPIGGCVSINVAFRDHEVLRCYTSGDERRLIKGIAGAWELLKERSCVPIPEDVEPWPDVFTEKDRGKLKRMGIILPHYTNPRSNVTAADHKLAADYRKRLADAAARVSAKP